MVTVAGEAMNGAISSILTAPGGPEDRPTVGDWLLIDRESQHPVRILDRTSLFKRPAPGDERRIQLIAANVDTLFVVTSCDQDFNVARIERYLVLAGDVGVRPVVVLTKSDLSGDTRTYVAALRAIEPMLRVEAVNGLDPESVAGLAAYCGAGETVALVGSSGVGKSTLIGTLTGCRDIATQPVRESDGKGLHTTTVRQMHRLDGGGWLVDTPGMRELQMSEVAAGVAEVFDDIVATTLECRFTDCSHADEPGCAIRAAGRDGTIEPARLERWRKLTSENLLNSRNAAIRRNRQARPGKRT